MKRPWRRFVSFLISVSLLLLAAGGARSNVAAIAPADAVDDAYAALDEPPSSPFIVQVNIPERRLRLYNAPEGAAIDDRTPVFAEYRVAVGLRRYPTPVMDGSIVSKRPKPAWYVPRTDWAGDLAGQVIPFSSRENPFRARNAEGRLEGYFLALGRHGIGLHSTREARSIGRLASHGCIRMNLDDVRTLYHLLPHGTPVSTVYRLYRIEENDGGLTIRVFDDVYRRLSANERRIELENHLARHGLPVEILREEELSELLAGREVHLSGVTPHRVVTYGEEYSVAGHQASGSRDAAGLLARTVLAMPR